MPLVTTETSFVRILSCKLLSVYRRLPARIIYPLSSSDYYERDLFYIIIFVSTIKYSYYLQFINEMHIKKTFCSISEKEKKNLNFYLKNHAVKNISNILYAASGL